MQEMQVWSLGWEDPLEGGVATHSSILAWRIPWTEEPGGLQSIRLQRVTYNWSYWARTHVMVLPRQWPKQRTATIWAKDLQMSVYVIWRLSFPFPILLLNTSCTRKITIFQRESKQLACLAFAVVVILSCYLLNRTLCCRKGLPQWLSLWVQSLGWEDALEEGVATHSSVLSWRIPWTEEPGRLQCIGLQRVRHDWSDLARHVVGKSTCGMMHNWDA